jgi:actin-related protein
MGDGAVPSLFIPPPLRPSRCTYDVAGNATLVVDNGAFCCRAGWAGEAAPRVQFRSLVSRPKAAVPVGAAPPWYRANAVHTTRHRSPAKTRMECS